MCRCALAAAGSVSVTANTATRSATSPWLMKRFSPLISQSSPLRTARVAHARGVRTGACLCQGERGQLVARGEVGKPTLFLLVRAAMHERQRSKFLHRRNQPLVAHTRLSSSMTSSTEIMSAPRPPYCSGNASGEEVVLREQVDHVPRKLALPVDLGGRGARSSPGLAPARRRAEPFDRRLERSS